jgi:hypothetical protein
MPLTQTDLCVSLIDCLQVGRNRESTQRQYCSGHQGIHVRLAGAADRCERRRPRPVWRWHRSSAAASPASTAEFALGHVGIERSASKYPTSRATMPIARSCGLTDTLIGDCRWRLPSGDVAACPARPRLNGGIRNKTARGELRRGPSRRLRLASRKMSTPMGAFRLTTICFRASQKKRPKNISPVSGHAARLGISRRTVWQSVKRGEIEAISRPRAQRLRQLRRLLGPGWQQLGAAGGSCAGSRRLQPHICGFAQPRGR